MSDDLEEAHEFIESLNYDAIVLGSDTVWELERHPKPPNIYFLPSVTTPTFAFAASVDPAPEADSPWYGNRAELRRPLESFQVLSVRDEATRTFLERLGVAPSRISFLPDPTILCDFGMHVGGRNRPTAGPRPLAGVAASPYLGRNLSGLLVDLGFDIVSLMGSRQLDRAIAPPLLASVRQRLGLYPWLDVTVTDRFHMTIFALQHGRGPVIFLEDATRWRQPNSKGRDLLLRLGLEPMVWRLHPDEASPERLRAIIKAWPDISHGLTDRIKQLRAEAELTGYAGIVPALKAITLGSAS